MLVYSPFQSLFGGTSVLFAERRGAQIRSDSIKSFSITPTVISANEDYLVFRFVPPSDRSLLCQFFSFICAEAVAVEVEDLSRLITDKLVRAGLVQNWSAVAPGLSKLTPDEVFDSIEKAAVFVFSARPDEVTQENNADSRWLRDQQEQKSLADIKAAGLKDPLEAWNREDERRQAEAFAYREKQNAGIDEFMPDPEPQTEPQYSHSGFLVNPTEGEF